MRQTSIALILNVLLAACAAACAEEKFPFPRAQVIPQPGDQLSFQLDGREVLRYHYAPEAGRPYFFPVIGPAGRPITRIGHPRDPHSHQHHMSLWIGHQDVNGQNFWEFAKGSGKIVHDRLLKFEDGKHASATLQARWLDTQNTAILIDERTWTLLPREGVENEYFLDLSITLTPLAATATLGKTHFGLLAVRVAKTMGVNDGGGKITNSEGQLNEKEVLWQRARWCDYSGPAAPDVNNGITLFDHPGNPNHPVHFHVRNDGWMGASATDAGAITISKEQPLKLSYRLWIHAGPCDVQETERHWRKWTEQSNK